MLGGDCLFGYIKVSKGELKIKEYELYRAINCGLCKSMQKYTTKLSAVALSYDIVFLAIK